MCFVSWTAAPMLPRGTEKKKPRVGVELDNPNGKNNGTVGEFRACIRITRLPGYLFLQIELWGLAKGWS